MKSFEEEMEELYFTENPPIYNAKIYNDTGDDFIEIFLATDENSDGLETQKTIHFVQVLIENNVAFSLEHREGGKWWNSEEKAYMEYRKRKNRKTGGDED